MPEARAYCPYCRQDTVFQETAEQRTCTACGQSFQRRPTVEPVEAGLPKAYGWLLFLAVLLAPGSLVALIGLFGGGEELGIGALLISVVVSSLICGIWLSVKIGSSPAMVVLLAILFIPLMGVACCATGFAGCAIGQQLHQALPFRP